MTSATSIGLLALNFAVSLWFGAYLLSRDPASDRLRLTGLGLTVHAFALLCLLFDPWNGPWAAFGELLCGFLPAIPAVLWTGSLISLLPETHPLRSGLKSAWAFGQVPLFISVYFLRISTGAAGRYFTGSLIDYLFALLVLFPLLAAAFLILRLASLYHPRRAMGMLLVGLLLFSVSTAFVLLPLAWFPRSLILAALGIDLLILGVAISVLDAFDMGEAFLPDFVRSGVGAGLAAILFGLPFWLAISMWTGPSQPMLMLLFAVLSLAIFWQTFRERIDSFLDRLLFSGRDELSSEHASLIGTARAITKIDPKVQPLNLAPEQFARLTRQAISQFGNLPRLAASPLTRLPVIDRRLTERGIPASTLARASELKALLEESILQLKPAGSGTFGETEEWRHYNALYFPYVAGIRPYARRQTSTDLPPAERRALEWIRSQVPERTLYNWQQSAARLVAEHLREAA